MKETNLKYFLYIFLFLLSSCAQVKIVESSVKDINNKLITLELVTNKDLKKYKNSFYAHHVYLNYMPSNTLITTEFDNPPKPWKFPFSSSFIKSEPCGNKNYCSIWRIPVSRKMSISLNDYEYILKKGDSIILKLGGGTMHGTVLKSNIITQEIK